jgi:hypothetical protein
LVLKGAKVPKILDAPVSPAGYAKSKNCYIIDHAASALTVKTGPKKSQMYTFLAVVLV